MKEPKVVGAQIIDSVDGVESHSIVCTMDDGQAYIAIEVDPAYSNLTQFLADALNEASRLRDFEKKEDDRIKRQSQLVWSKFPEVKISRTYYDGDNMCLRVKFIPDDREDEFFDLMHAGAFFLKDEYSAPIVPLLESEMKESHPEEYEEWKSERKGKDGK